MPEAQYPLRIAEEFINALAGIYSDRLLSQIRDLLETLKTFPEIGSANVRACLSERYGANLRKIPVSTFVIVYRFDGKAIDVLALVYGPTIV